MQQIVPIINLNEIPGANPWNIVARLLNYATTNNPAFRFSVSPTGGLQLLVDPDALGGSGGGIDGQEVLNIIAQQLLAGGIINLAILQTIADALATGGSIQQAIQAAIGSGGAHPFTIAVNNGQITVFDGSNPNSGYAGIVYCGTRILRPVTVTESLAARSYYVVVWYESGAYHCQVVSTLPSHSKLWVYAIGSVAADGTVSQPFSADYYAVRITDRWVD